MCRKRQIVQRSVLALGVLFTVSHAAEAGPPLICRQFDAGTASVLPWSTATDWKAPDRSYDVARLTADTLRLLSDDAPVLARMENLRRATIYAAQDRRVAAELLAAVLGRALTAAAEGSPDPLAWFDAGYLIESYRQASHIYQWDMLSGAERSSWMLRSEPEGLDGYHFVRKALDLGGSHPEMEFAASLMKEGSISADHRQRAVAGAKAGSLLAKNLAS
ncbi:MAG: hypothetical protein GEU99_20080 [Luteitalea sp.]|nr:hypothetical protein [Luteitalea sp.]